ncbi:hypothetical protein Glove_117g469 [Diversispora epigaea]|uniref:Uncharacterized protein n=1 Tax=Diversispora epigaea TaxID=1348612 RepID=A0A397J0K3_9GLOM|nr:hypothetical protein Glove_117g469 [Diversispora epigaea]
MKFIGANKVSSISKLLKRSSNIEDPQDQSKKSLLHHFNITKFKIGYAKSYETEKQVIYYCTKYLNDFPTSYTTLCDRADAFCKLKKYDNAINDLNLAIQLKPQRSIAWYLRGEVKGFKESYTDAIDDLSKALRIDPINCFALKSNIFRELKNLNNLTQDLEIGNNNNGVSLNASDTKGKRKAF